MKQGAGACDSPAIPKTLIEKMVLSDMKTKMFTASNIANVARDLFQTIKNNLKTKRNKIKQLDKDIPNLHRKYTKLVDMVADSDELDLSDVAPRIKELKAEMEKLKAIRDSLVSQSDKLTFKTVDKQSIIDGYVQLIQQLLEDESLITQETVRKLIKGISIDYPEYVIEWSLPNPQDVKGKKVLPAVDLVAGAGLEPATFGL